MIFTFSGGLDVQFGLDDVDLFVTIAICGQGDFRLIRLHSRKELLVVCVGNFEVEVWNINYRLF